MKVNDYRNTMNGLVPGEEKKQQIWAEITMHKSTSRKRGYRPAGITAAVAAMACVVLLSGAYPALAGSVKAFFQGFFTMEQNSELDQSSYGMQKQVEKDLFYEEDGHVSIHVLELISDGMTAYATVKYTALDEEGRQWLEENADRQYFGEALKLYPAFPDNNLAKYGVNLASSGHLIPELSDDKEKYFCVSLEAASDEYGADEFIFHYFLSYHTNLGVPVSAFRETRLTAVTGNIEFVKYKVLQTGQKDSGIRPQYLYVSGLSYKLYVKVAGDSVWEEKMGTASSFGLEFQDGSSWLREDEAVTSVRGDKSMGLVSGGFTDDEYRRRTFDSEAVVRLVFDGVEYELVRE